MRSRLQLPGFGTLQADAQLEGSQLWSCSPAWVPSQGCASHAVSGLGTAAPVPGQKVTSSARVEEEFMCLDNRHFILQTSSSHQL